MKIKYFIVCFLLVLLGICVYFVVVFKQKNSDLKKEYNSVSEKVKQNEYSKDVYFKKVEELDKLKESNKDKVSKYEEVSKWNEEIKGYLD